MSSTTPFRVIATGLRFPEGPIALADGTFLVVEIAGQALTRIADGTKAVVANLDGGPNGAAMGPDGWCYICNSGGWLYTEENGQRRPIGQTATSGWIERVHLETGQVERLCDRVGDVALRSPNDIVFDAQGGFWFTDHGKRTPRTLDVTQVYYARRDGTVTAAISSMVTPNGIGLSPDERTLYVAETLPRRLWAFDIAKPGVIDRKPWPSQNGGRLVAGLPDNNALDSMAIDSEGHICVASIMNGGIWRISPDGRQRIHLPLPDIYTTNICFGGPDLMTGYATLSASGRLVAFDWPVPGHPLNYVNRSRA